MFLIKTLPQIEVMPPCLDRPTYSKYFQIFPNVILLFSHLLFDKSTAILHLRHWSSPCYFGCATIFPWFFGHVVFHAISSHPDNPVTVEPSFRPAPDVPPKMRQCPSSPSSLKISGRDTANCRIRSLYRSSCREKGAGFSGFSGPRDWHQDLFVSCFFKPELTMDTIWYYDHHGRYYGL